jgi:F0F1-type ATP synthase membrane subunit b/b'
VGRDLHDVGDAYALLVELTERELELARAGATEELDAVQRRRGALLAELPAQAPESAREHLERAAELQVEITKALAEQLRDTSAELRKLDGGRKGIKGYAPSAGGPSLVDRAG